MNRTQFSSLISKGGKKMKHGNKMNGKNFSNSSYLLIFDSHKYAIKWFSGATN